MKRFLAVVATMLLLLPTGRSAVVAARDERSVTTLYSIRKGKTQQNQSGEYADADESSGAIRRRLFRHRQSDDSSKRGSGGSVGVLDGNDSDVEEPSSSSTLNKRRGIQDPSPSAWSGNKLVEKERSPSSFSSGWSRRGIRDSPPTLSDQSTSANDDLGSNVLRKRRPSPPVSEEYETNLNESCLLSATGFYGSPTGAVYSVQYLYQVQFKAGTTLEAVRTQLLPQMDRALAQGVVKALFDCDHGGRRELGHQRRTRQLQRAPRGVFRGASSTPMDEIVINQSCVELPVDAASNCYMFQGHMILIAENFPGREAVDAFFQIAVSNVIQSTVFDQVSDNIERVQYLTPGVSLVEANAARPSLVPSSGPHSNPSVGPGALPSLAPSVVPSAFPSNAPAAVNSGSPSLAPSASPYSSCALNDSGFFGTSKGTAYEVQYFYQVQFVPGTTLAYVLVQHLPALDRAMAQGLIHVLFDCQDKPRRWTRGLRKQRRQGTRHLQQLPLEGVFRGVSSRPIDEIVVNQPCVLDGSAAVSSNCYVFKGYMTLISENFPSPEAVDASFQTGISTVIQSNIFDPEVSASIEQVQYLTVDDFNASRSGMPVSVPSSSSPSENPVATTPPPTFKPSGVASTAIPSETLSTMSPSDVAFRPIPSEFPSTMIPSATTAAPAPTNNSVPTMIPSATSQTPSSSLTPTAAPNDPVLRQSPMPGSPPPTAAPASTNNSVPPTAEIIPRASPTARPTADFDFEIGTRAIDPGESYQEPYGHRLTWWGWLLIALGAAAITIAIAILLAFLIRNHRGEKPTNGRSRKGTSSDGEANRDFVYLQDDGNDAQDFTATSFTARMEEDQPNAVEEEEFDRPVIQVSSSFPGRNGMSPANHGTMDDSDSDSDSNSDSNSDSDSDEDDEATASDNADPFPTNSPKTFKTPRNIPISASACRSKRNSEKEYKK